MTSIVTIVAFAISLALFLLERPLRRPSQKDRMAFELGYYRAVCTHDSLRSNAPTLVPQIRRLSDNLGVPVPGSDARCPRRDSIARIKLELSQQRFNSFVLGDNVASFEFARLLRSEQICD